MTLIVCVDNKNGVLFNRRRQSQDKVLRARVLDHAGNERLWMNAYSAKQFGDVPQLAVAEDFLAQAGPGDFCFLEGDLPTQAAEKVRRVILYRWNRDYPADVHFTFPLSDFTLSQTTEFPGSSHKTITEEVYTR